ncbi:MAG: family 1 glycosylhydrolase, partial [Chloroflexota bacterium]
MPEAVFNFPRGFQWGSATSSHQVEGNNTNNTWTAWEQQPGRVLNGGVAGLASDWWGGRWKEDFDRAAESGQNSLQLSIEWSRVQPTPDRWDENALDHYRGMIRGLDERGIKPLVTLHHFTDPLWLALKGGWENDEIIQLFTTYTEKVVDILGGFVDKWVTLNEPNQYTAQGYIHGIFPPGHRNMKLAFKVMENQIKAHAAAYQAIHKIQPHAQVGLAINYRGFQPANQFSPFDRYSVKRITKMHNEFFPQIINYGKARLLNKMVKISQVKGTQ